MTVRQYIHAVETPAYLRPFVLPVPPVDRERQDRIDLYLPEDDRPRPAVVFLHGGPVPPDRRPTPRDWPVYVGYAASAAARGVVGVTLDHRLADLADYSRADADLSAAVVTVRSDPRVDPDRIALWAFSGGAPLLAGWLADPPGWLRCVAASYPLLGSLPGIELDPAFRVDRAVAGAGNLPIVLSRAGQERPAVAATVESFVAAARAHDIRLEIIDVARGGHGFDVLEHTDESRDAVTRALDRVVSLLQH